MWRSFFTLWQQLASISAEDHARQLAIPLHKVSRIKKRRKEKKKQARNFGKGRVLRHTGPKTKRTDGSTDDKSTKAPKVTILYIWKWHALRAEEALYHSSRVKMNRGWGLLNSYHRAIIPPFWLTTNGRPPVPRSGSSGVLLLHFNRTPHGLVRL